MNLVQQGNFSGNVKNTVVLFNTCHRLYMQNTYTNMKGELIFFIKTIQKILKYGDTRLLISDKRQQYVHWMALALIAVLASPMLHWQSVCRWFQMRFMRNESLHVYIAKIMLLVFSYMVQKTTMSHSLSFCPPLGATRLVSGNSSEELRLLCEHRWTQTSSQWFTKPTQFT